MKIMLLIFISILLIKLMAIVFSIILSSKVILKIILPITNEKLKKKIPYLITIYRINYYKILEGKEFCETYNKILNKNDLLKEELDYLNRNIIGI